MTPIDRLRDRLRALAGVRRAPPAPAVPTLADLERRLRAYRSAFVAPAEAKHAGLERFLAEFDRLQESRADAPSDRELGA